jgi:hypothetical protein
MESAADEPALARAVAVAFPPSEAAGPAGEVAVHLQAALGLSLKAARGAWQATAVDEFGNARSFLERAACFDTDAEASGAAADADPCWVRLVPALVALRDVDVGRLDGDDAAQVGTLQQLGTGLLLAVLELPDLPPGVHFAVERIAGQFSVDALMVAGYCKNPGVARSPVVASLRACE